MRSLALFKTLLVALSMSTAIAQQTTTDGGLPALSDVTGATTSTAASTTTAASSATSATATSTGSDTSQTSGATSSTQSLVPVTLSSMSGVTSSTSTQPNLGLTLSGLPTIAGAGIPTMIVPYTANAPFMQHSDLPEGTVFIAVGAVLAFLGACVLLWRGLVAWSINRSVKRAALASIRGGSEKTTTNWGGSSTGYNPARGSMYKDMGDSMSMEALTASGKPIRSHFKDHEANRGTPPPQNLFFSPTAQPRTDAPRPVSDVYNNRSSSYLPAGYYAAPNSHVAGGARNTLVGGNAPMPPYARHSAVYEPSPPSSPALRPATSGTHGRTSNDQLRAPSRDGKRLSSTLYSHPSNSSLAVGLNGRPSRDGLAGSRAPSAYLEGLFENHTAMASRDHL